MTYDIGQRLLYKKHGEHGGCENEIGRWCVVNEIRSKCIHADICYYVKFDDGTDYMCHDDSFRYSAVKEFRPSI